MAIQRMDNVGIVVEDIDAAIAFFVELGMELEGRAQVEGLFADQCTGLDGVRAVTSRWSGPRTDTAGWSWRSTAAPR